MLQCSTLNQLSQPNSRIWT